MTRVSIHAPARGRPVQIMPVPTLMCFNPRPHARGDRTCLEPLDGHPCFNPRPHARGDFGSPLRSCAIKMFQSTPPHEGRHGLLCTFNVDVRVSIHATTRGATMSSSFTTCSFTFQSTPPRGGRLPTNSPSGQSCKFQSTPPREGRRGCIG